MTTTIKSEDIFHLLTGRTPLSLNRILSHKLKDQGISLTKEQWSVMAVLWKQDGITQQAIADATFRDRAGVTRLLDNLQKDKFIKREPHQEDRRTNLVYLTPKGRNIEEAVVQVLRETVKLITKDLGEEDVKFLRTIFERINKNIKEIEIY